MQEESQGGVRGGVRGGERSPFSGVGVSGPGLVAAPALLLALIHRSAWKGYSQKFADTVFWEVQRFLEALTCFAWCHGAHTLTLNRSRLPSLRDLADPA
jgi:hypothetical protein